MLNRGLGLSSFILWAVLLTSCADRTDVEKADGLVSVQIPIQTSASSYQLKNVELVGMKNLKEVSGQFAHFFYSPGLNNSQLSGSAPTAHFIKSGSLFIPTDIISAQMATIYYHMQNMAALDSQLGAGNINQWPRSIGLETQLIEKDGVRKNNAFYDGQTDAMMFVPFTETNLPISINAGIIAHEHFHSLFYKIVIKKAIATNKIAFNIISTHPKPILIDPKKMQRPPKAISEKSKILLFNEIYVRGLNEGLADFWGWLYTDDVDFMKWSLPTFTQARTLSLDHSDAGAYLTQQDIDGEINDLIQQTDKPRAELINFYKIGTPYARFLKEWVKLYSAQNEISAADAKLAIGKQIINYLYDLQKTISALEENQTLNPTDLFNYFANGQMNNIKLTQNTCEFLVSYLNYQKTDSKDMIKCIPSDSHVIMKKNEKLPAEIKKK